jgi:macrodomain Ter protein organizer (MatP/YcbG family)
MPRKITDERRDTFFLSDEKQKGKKTTTIHISPIVKERLNNIREVFQTKTYSDTILVLILEFERLKSEVNTLNKDIDDLLNQVNYYKDLLNEY